MGILKNIKGRITSLGLSFASDERVNLEMYNRGNGSGSTEVESEKIVRQPNLFTPKTIEDWKSAIALATDHENPNYLLLDELYQNLLLDAHAVSVIESRVFRVMRSRFNLLDGSNEPNLEVAELLNRPWFEEFIKHAMWSLFTGMKVLELYDTDEQGELLCTTSIPMAHIVPHKQQIAKEAGDDNGTPYTEGGLERYYMQIGNKLDLGILADLGTLILAKKQAMGAWIDHMERFGVPPIIINTDNYDKKRQDELLRMGLAMHNNHVMVTQGSEEFTMGELKSTDVYKIFLEFLGYCDSAISKRVLGQDGTTENKDGAGTYGSLKVMQDVANDRHESDKLFIEYLINKQLIPKLAGISTLYSQLTNYRFSWDDSDDVSRDELVDKVVSLTQAGYEIDHLQIAEKTGIPITGYRGIINQTPEDPKAGTKKKKLGRETTLKVAAYYSNTGCGDTSPPEVVAIDTKKWLSVINRIAKALHTGNLKPEQLDQDMINLTFSEMIKGTEEGYGKTWTDDLKKKGSIAQKLESHIYLFSGAKTYHQLVAMNDLLVDDTGKLRDFSEFRNEVLKVHDTYNLTYLETEYRTTKRSAQAARQWQTFVDNSDLFPNLKYRTIGDARVRDEHDKLDNIVKPINDSFWDTHYPPNGWNCRCRVQSSDATVTKGTPKITLDKGFANNVGKTGNVFDEEGHPFFKVPKKALKNILDGRK